MLALGIILCYLLGASVMLLISRRYSLAEWVSFSFLIGMGLETFLLFLLDVVGIRYSAGLITGINIALIAGINGANYKNLLELKEWKFPSFSWKDINPAAIFMIALTLYLGYVITQKNLFWPPTEHDTIGSFDKLGRIMAVEGKLKISLFEHHLEGAGGVYPPLYHASFAYVYIYGAVMPKIITTLFFISMLTGFYGMVSRYTGAIAASLFTFLFMVTPELFSHAALSLGNLPTTAYVGAAALCTFAWLDGKDNKYFWLGAILMGLVIWIRSDTIVFTAASLAVVGLRFLRTKEWKPTLIYGIFAVTPFIIWNLYLKFKIGFAQSGRFNFGMGYNEERMQQVTGYVKAYLLGGQYGNVDGGQLYGVVFVLFFIVLFVNLIMIYKAGIKTAILSSADVLLFIAVSFTLYFAVFYFIDVDAQNAPMWSLMESSFKRGMFCFVPLVLFYAASSYASSLLFGWVEKFRTGA